LNSLDFEKLVKNLIYRNKESEWLELKHDNHNYQEIGENISALANSAALLNRSNAYILWGIEDSSLKIVGTSFYPRTKKVGNQELESWLFLQLEPQINLNIHEGEIEGKHVVLFEIISAACRPICFKGTGYIRLGSYTKKLKDCPEKERELWSILSQSSFEKRIAQKNVSEEQIIKLLDSSAYFDLIKLPYPENRSKIIERFLSENLISIADNGNYNILNVGAILFAKNLENFGGLDRKSLRIIYYSGDSRIDAIKEFEVKKGYAIGFEDMVAYINDQLPQNEYIEKAFRQEMRMYPIIAIRELVANALIHQDFNISGTGPMVEIFSDRIEISNPGLPLIDPLRFIDETPQSRNEILAKHMRRLNLCEERGSGIDKVIFQIELFQLPAPDFITKTQSTFAMMYRAKNLKQMDLKERIRATYQHACLQYVTNKKMTNESLRTRLGIKQSSYSLASRIIRDSIKEKLVKPQGNSIGAGKSAYYLPFWA
jgi:predicted HTH transcriptional regulator